MKKVISILISLLLVSSMLFSTIPAFANHVTASLLNNPANSSWMSGIKDDTKICDISIPGTHDSAARIVDTMTGTWAQTQSMTIYDQLTSGVRFLDLRVRYNSSVYYGVEMCHSSVTIWNGNGGHLTLYQVIGDIKNFLSQYPTETVIVCIKEDDGSNESKIVDAINQIKAEDPSFWYQSYATPTLGQVRGKMVVGSRMSSMTGIWYGWGDQGSDGSYVQPYSNVIIQDRYNMGRDNKWNNAIQPTLDLNKPNGTWLFNCLNTTGGGIEGVSANSNAINDWFNKYITKNNKCYGIITFDYVNDDLTTKVIKCNDLVTKNQPNNLNGQYYYRLNVNNPDPVASGWTNAVLKLYYKTNNGTGNEYVKTIFDPSDEYNGYKFVCSAGNYEFSGALTGYPTKVEFTYDWGYGSDRLELDFKLYVSNSPNASQTQIMDTFFARTSGTSSPQRGTDTFNVDTTKNPRASSIDFLNDEDTIIEVPAVGSNATETNTFNTYVYDQYGVKWYKGATSYYLYNDVEGLSFTNNVLNVTEQANNNPQNKTTIVMAKYIDGSTNLTTGRYKRVILHTKPIPYSYVDESNNVLYSSSAYYGETPQFVGDVPSKQNDDTLHYTFAGWTPTILSTTSNKFSPLYDVAKHRIVNDSKSATCTESGYLHVYCADCDYVQSNETYDPLDHDYINAVKGSHIDSSKGNNGYIPYYCPRCNEELVELREYDENDFSAYYEALRAYRDVLNDIDYSSYNATSRYTLESRIDTAKALESMTDVYQYDIDSASTMILSAIDDFATEVGVTYHNISFVSINNDIYNVLYKEGTPASLVTPPANTQYKIDDTTHTVYTWQSVKDVTQPASYYEVATVSNHTFNTFIFPDVTVQPTYTEQGTITHKCLCGYTCTEYIPVLEYDVEIVYILDNEVLRKETKTAPLGANIDIEIPSDYSYYKTTIEKNGTTTRLPSTSIIIDNNCEIVVYLYSN